MQAATKGGGEAVSPVDICKTQVGEAEVPIPYPNLAELSNAQDCSEKVVIAGSNALNLGSSISSSTTGPGVGLIGGLVSNTLNGECRFTAGSTKVIIEGQPALRLNDPTTQNKNNCEGTIAAPSQAKVLING